MLKKIVFGAIGLLLLLLVIGIVAPFIIDFNKFKPQIQALVADKLNARVDFSSARLTVFTGLGVALKDVVVTNTDPKFVGTPLVSVKDLVVYADVFPLLAGKLVGHIKILKPRIQVVTAGTQNNLAALPKSNSPAAPAPKSGAVDQKQLAEFKKRVVIQDIILQDADISQLDFVDLKSKTGGAARRISGLNLTVKNIGIDKDIMVKMRTALTGSTAGATAVGDVSLDAVIRIALQGTELKTATIAGKLNLDSLNIAFRDLFTKAKSIPLNLKFSISATPSSIQLKEMILQLHTLQLVANGQVKDLDQQSIQATVKLKAEDLNSFGSLLPQHKALLQRASLDLQLNAEGSAKDLSKMKVDMVLKSILTGSDLAVDAKFQGLMPPRGVTTVRSGQMDIGALVGPFLKPSGAPKETEPGSKRAEEVAATKSSSPNDIAAQMRGADVSLNIDMKNIKYGKAVIPSFVMRARQDNLVSTLNSLDLSAFGAKVTASATAQAFANPIVAKVDVSLLGNRMDINALQKEVAEAIGSDSTDGPGKSPDSSKKSSTAGSQQPQDLSALALPTELKKLLQGIEFNARVAVKEIKHEKVTISDFDLKFALKALQANLQSLKLRAFESNVNVTTSIDLSRNPLTVRSGVNIQTGSLNVNKIMQQFGLPPLKISGDGAAKSEGTAPQPAADTKAQTEFQLTPGQKKLLGGVTADFMFQGKELIVDTLKITNINLNVGQLATKLTVKNFAMDLFDGKFGFTGGVSLEKSPLSFEGKTNLDKIRIEKLVALVKPQHKDVLQGIASFDMNMKGLGSTTQSITKTLDAKGKFTLLQGQLKSGSLIKVAQDKLDETLGGLSILSVADSSFKQAEGILANPLVKQTGLAGKFDMAKYKGDYDKFRNVRISGKVPEEKSLQNIPGGLEIRQGKITITSKKSTPQGDLDLAAKVGLDMGLGGTAVFNPSAQQKSSLLAQSRHADMIFDEKGQLNLLMNLSGTVSSPAASIDMTALKDRFVRNAKIRVENEVKKGAEAFVQGLLKGKADLVMGELKKQQAIAKAKIEAEKSKLQQQGKEKVQDAIKKNLDGLKLPGFGR